MHDDIGTGTEPESNATLSEQAMMLLARLTDLSSRSAAARELEREILAALRQVESDTLQRAAEICTEFAHERGDIVEAFAHECGARLMEVGAQEDPQASDLQSADIHSQDLHGQDLQSQPLALEESSSDTTFHG